MGPSRVGQREKLRALQPPGGLRRPRRGPGASVALGGVLSWSEEAGFLRPHTDLPLDGVIFPAEAIARKLTLGLAPAPASSEGAHPSFLARGPGGPHSKRPSAP